LSSTVQYRKGMFGDLTSLGFDDGLSLKAESIEFNVLGLGHEFWIAVQGGVVIGLGVLAKEDYDGDNFLILHLEVAPSRKNEGIGSALLKAILKANPKSSLSVIPFGGTQDFYQSSGFQWVSRWEMRRGPEVLLGVSGARLS